MADDFVCGFCKTPYNNPVDYASCVARCAAAQREAERIATEKKRREKEEEEKSRKAAALQDLRTKIEQAEKELTGLYEQLYSKYPKCREAAIKTDADLIDWLYSKLLW